MTRDESEARTLFRGRYAIARHDVHRQIERAVIGGDWGANGYTTMVEADELALQTAMARAAAENLAARSWAVMTGARRLPLRPGGIDAVVAADVLC